MKGSYIRAGYEDPLHYLLQEGVLPENVDPLTVDLKDDLERKRLTRVLTAGLGTQVGYVLPIHWSHKLITWSSSPWEFRRGEMFLLPGDSAMGLRLPLNSLPWVAYKDRDHEPETQSVRSGGTVTGYGCRDQPSLRQRQQQDHRSCKGKRGQTQMDAAHRALCGSASCRLYIFVPPTTALEHYLDIIASVEATSKKLNMPVVVEGYQPPHDLRLTRLPVTPDPGVIEVNIHPAKSWKETGAQHHYPL